MVESSTNLKRIASELVKKAITDNKVSPSARDIKNMIEKIVEEHKGYGCLICFSLLYEPRSCSKCETAVMCEICIT